MLAGEEVEPGGSHPRAVGSGCSCFGRELALADRTAPTAQLVDTVLGDDDLGLWDLEDLAHLFVHQLCARKVGAAARAGLRGMGDDMVGIFHLGEVGSGCTGLLAGLPSHRSAGLAVRALLLGGLGEDVRGRWHGRVLRVAPELLLELGDGASQHLDLLFERRDLFKELSLLRCLALGQQPQRCDELLQLLVGGLVSERGGVVGRNSPRYARRSRKWGMVYSEHVNGYLDAVGIEVPLEGVPSIS